MLALRRLLVLVPLGLAGACASQPAATPAAHAAPRANDDLAARFPAPKSGLTLGVQADALKLADVLEQVSKSTGVVYSANEQALAMLRQVSVQISRPVTIGPESLYPWFESLLVQHGFLLSVAARTQPPLVTISMPGSQREGLAVTDVPPAQIDFCREHPAVLVTTTLELPHVDVRTLGNSLRAMTSDSPNLIMPVGNTNSVLLSGSGRQVASLIDLLQRVETAAAAGQDARAVLAAEAAKAK